MYFVKFDCLIVLESVQPRQAIAVISAALRRPKSSPIRAPLARSHAVRSVESQSLRSDAVHLEQCIEELPLWHKRGVRTERRLDHASHQYTRPRRQTHRAQGCLGGSVLIGNLLSKRFAPSSWLLQETMTWPTKPPSCSATSPSVPVGPRGWTSL